MTEETKKKMAIVVIHGIGEQQPFEALGKFANKFQEEYRTKRSEVTLEHNLVWFENCGESCIVYPRHKTSSAVHRRWPACISLPTY